MNGSTTASFDDVAEPEGSASVGRALVWLLCVALRLVTFPFAQNVGGDAIARTWLAVDWAANPHLVTSYADGVAQYGPLHIVLIGLLARVWNEPLHVGRVVSLAFGIAALWPLMALARRFFGERAALVAGVVFSLWGMHVQASTTAASEALCIFLVLAAVAVLHAAAASGRLTMVAGAALLTTLACATRYDVWLWAPIFWGWLTWRTRSLRVSALFGVLAAAFPVLWMWGNFTALGDALYPLHVIDAFHRSWFVTEAAFWGDGRYRLISLGFWPGMALLSLSPLVALASFVGATTAARRHHESAWLVWLLVITAGLYTFRSVALSSFAPLSRFTVKELALLCLFVEPGGVWLAARTRVRDQSVLGVVLASAAVWLVALALLTERGSGSAAESMVPLSPRSRNAARLEPVLQALQALTAGGDGLLLLDADPNGYDELTLKFYGGVPRFKVANRRATNFEETLASGTPQWLVRFDGGPLEVTAVDGALQFRAWRFVTVGPKYGAVQLYQRATE